MTSSPTEPSGGPSRIALYVVVISRVLYSGVATVALTFFLGFWVLGWRFVLWPRIRWFFLFAAVALVVVWAGFWMWVALSWGTAYILCPSVRSLEVGAVAE